MRHAARLGLLGALLASEAAAAPPEPVQVRIEPVDLLAEPARYLLRLECGDFSLANVSVGLILPPNTIPAQVDFGGCLQQAGLWNCANAQGLGVTVDKSASGARMGTGGVKGRTDTLYARLAGTPLCTDGQPPVDLAQIAVTNLVPDPAPMLVATSQLVDDVFGLPHHHALTSNNAVVPIDQIRYESGPEADGPEFVVEPVPLTDPGSLDHRFVLLLEGAEAFDQITVGLILPQGVSAAQVSFGGCTDFTGGNLAERDCIAGSPDLGPNVDAALSGTLGPAAGLALDGARTDTLYLVLDGRQPLGGNRTVLNLPGSPSRLGVLEFDEVISADLEDLLPPLTTLGTGSGSLPPWVPMFALSEKGKSKGARGSDSDGDGPPDTGDKCPHYAETDRFADADSDNRGNECECTDQDGDGDNDVNDLLAINRAIFNPDLETPLCDGNNDSDCSVRDILAANVEIFSPTSTSICSRQPVPGPP